MKDQFNMADKESVTLSLPYSCIKGFKGVFVNISADPQNPADYQLL